jgi:flagellar biogenesis protein FliO
MSEVAADNFVDGSSFFGFMGVTLALILASMLVVMQILEQPMGQPKQAQELVASRFGDPPWS